MADYFFYLFYFFTLTILALFGIHKFFLIYTYRKFRSKKLPEKITPKQWPLVAIQLPVFNEKFVVKRLLKSIVQLDYPKEKLDIQLLDDSTDITVKISQKLVRILKQKGFHIRHIRRPDRTGFKAGALQYGLNRTEAEFIAIFDADFVPEPDFLKKTIPYLLNPKIGMVQTRWGHINRNYSLLTKLQAIFLDAHFLIEHLARNRSERFFNFNGTAGIWRKQAIQDAGGWQHDTLTEDLDLSYRAQISGWKFLYLPDVVAPAELPADMNAYKSQQHRWAKGSVQTAIKLIPSILKADLPLFIRLEAIIHLSNNFAYLLMIIPALLMIPVLGLKINSGAWWPVYVYLFMFFAGTFSVVVYYAVALRESQGKIWPNILYLPLLISLGIGLSVNNGRAALEAIAGKKSDFIRTPKSKIEGRKKKMSHTKYKLNSTWYYLIELGFAVYFSLGMIHFVLKGYYLSLPFFLFFQFGFLYLAFSSFQSSRS